MKNYEKVAEILSSGFLIAAGVLGTLVAILDFIGIDFTQGPWQWLKGPLPIILITVSILSLAIGLERYIRLRQIDNQFARLENLIERSSGGRFISSFEELYSEAIRLAENTRLRLRTASMSRDVQASNAYRTSIIDLISQNEKRIRPILVDMVIAGDFKNKPEEVHSSWRVGKFAQNKSVNLHAIDISWGLDILIIDTEHMIISFPAVRGMGQLKLGFVFINQPGIVREFANWYDDFLLKSAISYEEFLEKYPTK